MTDNYFDPNETVTLGELRKLLLDKVKILDALAHHHTENHPSEKDLILRLREGGAVCLEIWSEIATMDKLPEGPST